MVQSKQIVVNVMSFLRSQKRSRIAWILAGLFVMIMGASCRSPVRFVQSGGPLPPISDPNLLAEPGRAMQRISTQAELASCVESGLTAFGIALQNSNVRIGPSTDDCRIGRIPKGSLVEIIGVTTVESSRPTVPRPAPVTGPTVGYIEDIQPIFQKNCSTCHSPATRLQELVATAYEPLMAGSINGPVVVPKEPGNSKLWEMISTNKMPLIGALTGQEKSTIEEWIAQGAAEQRAPRPKPVTTAAASEATWAELANPKLDTVTDACKVVPASAPQLVSSDLILPVSCGTMPSDAELKLLLAQYALPGGARTVAQTATGGEPPVTTEAASTSPEETASAAVGTSASATVPTARSGVAGGSAAIQAAALGLPAPSDADPYLTPAGFCMDRRLPNNQRGITAITFAPDGRMFLALDSDLTNDIDPLILYDAYHPSRSIATYDWATDSGFNEIFLESSRITGLDYTNGALFLSRAGEVGRIPDGAGYEKLADGFAVASQLFHANNGIVVSDGWVYVSAGGVRDGYVEGPIVGIGEQGAQDIVSGGNPYAARIVRAPLDTLVSTRRIDAFSTAGRGVRNPYGIARDPAGRIWFTDNGATNVPDEISAGDEVNTLEPGAIGGDEGSTPYFGFPLALSGSVPDWYTPPVVDLENSAAPTGITWAYGTLFYAQYGRNPGLYRLGRTSDGTVVSERIMMGWPILAVATAPDGAIWVGMGNGNLFRLTPGC